MSRLSVLGRKFLNNVQGAVTIDWVAVTATFVVVGIGIVYTIFGDDEEGLIALINARQETLGKSADNVDNMLSEVESWSPGGS